MPVPVVVPLDLLVQSVVFFQDERLRAQLVLGLLLLLLLLFCSCRFLVVRAFLQRLSLLSHNQRLISELALVDEYVGIAHAQHLLVVAKAIVV